MGVVTARNCSTASLDCQLWGRQQIEGPLRAPAPVGIRAGGRFKVWGGGEGGGQQKAGLCLAVGLLYGCLLRHPRVWGRQKTCLDLEQLLGLATCLIFKNFNCAERQLSVENPNLTLI